MSDGCRCWTNTNALGHEGHCCFTVDGAWRADDAVCHNPKETR